MNINFSQSVLSITEYWRKQGFPGKTGTSNIGVSEKLLKEDIELESLDKVVEIVKKRLISEHRSLITAVIGEEDFLPLSFFEKGIKQSFSVCRIVRYFSLKAFKEFIEEIENEVKKTDVMDYYKKLSNVKEIFSIPEQVAAGIFKDNSNPLEDLKNISENQLAKFNPVAIGSGFLVGGTHLLTNDHVIPDEKTAKQCVAQFNYAEDIQAHIQEPIEYEFAPELLFISEENLDYTLVQLKSGMFTRQAGFQFGWIQLVEDDENICPGFVYSDSSSEKLTSGEEVEGKGHTIEVKQIKDIKEKPLILFRNNTEVKSSEGEHDQNDIGIKQKSQKSLKQVLEENNIKPETKDGDTVIIIQHPKGKNKQIALNDKVIEYGLYKNFLRYKTDTDYGSSGSPVFNTRWELVALHHAAIFHKPDEQKLDITEQQQPQRKVIAQQGVRICRIVEDLKKKSLTKPKLASFIEDFIVTSEQLNYPPLPSALSFDGEKSYVDLGAHESLDTTQEFTVETWVQCNPMSGNGTIINREGAYSLSLAQGTITIKLQNNDKTEFSTEKSVLNDGLWHHIAFTWDSKNIAIYVDGENETIENERIVFVSGDEHIQGEIGKSQKSLYIGCAREKRNYFKGSIAEVHLWSVVRQLEDIKKTMYQRLNSDEKKGLIGYWRFEEGEDMVYNLAQISVHDPSSIDFSQNIKIQDICGLRLNGEGYIDCGNSESLDIKEAITIEAWVKNNDINQGGFIVSRGGSWQEKGYSLWRWDKKIRVELQNDNEQIIVDTKESVLNDDLWHHIAFTWEQNSTEVQIYVNGERQEIEFPIYVNGEKQEIEFAENTKKNFQGPIGEPRAKLNIGRSENFGHYFKASIAEVCLWKVARTQDQIKADMQGKLEGKETGLIGYWRLDEEEGDKAMNLVSKNYSSVYGGEWLGPYSALAPSLFKENQGIYGITVEKPKRLIASQYPTLPLPIGLKFSEQGDYIDCGSGESLNTPSAITVEAWVKHKFGNCVIVSRGGTVEQNSRVGKGYSLS